MAGQLDFQAPRWPDACALAVTAAPLRSPPVTGAVSSRELTRKEELWLKDAKAFLANPRSGLQRPAAAAPENHGEGRDFRRRLQSINFLAWQKAQLTQSLQRRSDQALAAASEHRMLAAAVQAETEEAAQADEALARSEAELLRARQRFEDEVAQLWNGLDKREADLEAAAKQASEAAGRCSAAGTALLEAGQLSASAVHQAAVLKRETVFLVDLQQELETRDASLQCAEAAFACLLGRGTSEPDAMQLLEEFREGVAGKLMESLQRDRPRLASGGRGALLRKAVLSALGSGRSRDEPESARSTPSRNHNDREAKFISVLPRDSRRSRTRVGLDSGRNAEAPGEDQDLDDQDLDDQDLDDMEVQPAGENEEEELSEDERDEGFEDQEEEGEEWDEEVFEGEEEEEWEEEAELPEADLAEGSPLGSPGEGVALPFESCLVSFAVPASEARPQGSPPRQHWSPPVPAPPLQVGRAGRKTLPASVGVFQPPVQVVAPRRSSVQVPAASPQPGAWSYRVPVWGTQVPVTLQVSAPFQAARTVVPGRSA
eukprot:TRINITY_DN5487_c0_g1_i1.p1 TRINITY_DN5487_c0_g1~~TRINITY_DN5487_c0_g1_i1.p1  ORF type:complete len:544 (+),score=147.97 TRINITY_DN5487_c0_g1_i1:129-1760(+)